MTINDINSNGYTALMYACAHDEGSMSNTCGSSIFNIEFFELLLESGAAPSINLMTPSYSALKLACKAKNCELITFLLNHGADYNILFTGEIPNNSEERNAMLSEDYIEASFIVSEIERIEQIERESKYRLKGGYKNNNYLKKYLKYKNKYLELKNKF